MEASNLPAILRLSEEASRTDLWMYWCTLSIQSDREQLLELFRKDATKDCETVIYKSGHMSLQIFDR